MKILAFLLWFMAVAQFVVALFGNAAWTRRMKRDAIQAAFAGNHAAFKARESVLFEAGEPILPMPIPEVWHVLRAASIAIAFAVIGFLFWNY